MADETNITNDQLYYDMLDEAAAIDGVVHDLIGTLKEEDVNKGIFVAKENDEETAEVKFHLIAKDMKSTIDYLMGGGDENEILVGDENNRIKGSEVYLKKSGIGIEEKFNSDVISLKGNQSRVLITPNIFNYSFEYIVNEETGESVAPDIYTNFGADPESIYLHGKSSTYSCDINLGATYTKIISQNNQTKEMVYNLSIDSNGVQLINNNEKRININDKKIYLRGGKSPHDYTYNDTNKISSTIQLEGYSRIMLSDKYFHVHDRSEDEYTNPLNFQHYITEYTGAQLLMDDSGSAFIRGHSLLYLDSEEPRTGQLPYSYDQFPCRDGIVSRSDATGPIIGAQGKPYVYFGGSPMFSVCNNARVMMDGNTRFTMHGCAKVDITGRDNGNLNENLDFDNSEGSDNKTPKIFIHDGVKINIDSGYDGTTYDYNGRKRGSGSVQEGPNVPELVTNDNITRILIHDSPTIEISKGAYFRMSETALIDSDGNSTFIMHDNGYLEMAGNSIVTAHDNASFMMDKESLFTMVGNGYSPVFSMNGPAGFKMQSNMGHQGPLLLGETQSLIFLGNGMRDNRSNLSGWGRFNSRLGTESAIGNRLDNFITKKDFWGNNVRVGGFSSSNPSDSNFSCPALKLGGYVTFNLDSQNPGGVYVQMGNTTEHPDWGVNMFLQGDLYVKTGEHNHIELHGGWIQTTGNPHTEIHDNTYFVYRGNLTAGVPWMDGLKWEHAKQNEDGTIVWKSYNSSRSVMPVDSPVIQMYDTPNFYMRGCWTDNVVSFYEQELRIHETNSVYSPVFQEQEEGQEYTTISEELKAFIIDEFYKTRFGERPLEKNTNDETDAEEYLYNEDLFQILSVDSYIIVEKRPWSVTIKPKCTVQYIKPEGWTDRAIKAENSPVLEIIENADVRVSGNAIFNVDNTSLTIGNNEKIVTFTFDQLEQLKQLLS